MSREENYLISLLDDISLAPQAATSGNHGDRKIDDMQIKELESFVRTTNVGNIEKLPNLTLEQEKQFQIFFDKYEHDKKTNNAEIEKKEADYLNFYAESKYFGAPKILVPKLNPVLNEEPITVNEDLIEEVLLEKNLEKKYLCNPNNVQSFNDHKIYLEKRASPSLSRINENNGTKQSNIMNQIMLTNNVTSTTLKLDNKNINPTNNVFLYCKQDVPKQHTNVKIEELVSKYNMRYLESNKMDEKLFRQCTLKTETEKIHFTLGPTLQEKSVVLPQIMKRLESQKKSLDEHTKLNMNRKLVLDTGLSYINPIDVAKSNFTSNSKNNNFKENALIQNRLNSASQITTTPKHDKIAANMSASPKNNQEIFENSTSGLKNNPSSPSPLAYNWTTGESRFNHIDKLKALRRDKILVEKLSESTEVGRHVLEPPQMLMADCNKTRFVVNATSQLFNDFVNGKL